MISITEAEQLVEKGVELLSKVPPSVLAHAVDFLEGIVTGDNGKAERAATLATTEAAFDRPRGAK